MCVFYELWIKKWKVINYKISLVLILWVWVNCLCDFCFLIVVYLFICRLQFFLPVTTPYQQAYDSESINKYHIQVRTARASYLCFISSCFSNFWYFLSQILLKSLRISQFEGFFRIYLLNMSPIFIASHRFSFSFLNFYFLLVYWMTTRFYWMTVRFIFLLDLPGWVISK